MRISNEKIFTDCLDSPFFPFILVAVVTVFFLFGILRLNNFDASALVTAGDKFCDPALVPQNLVVKQNSDGFDGQFYYRLMLDPFTSKQIDFGITLDMPALRHQRILYPLFVWILSFGDETLIPFIMILINFFALCLLGWVGGKYAQSFKQHALWGIFLPLFPASLLIITRDLVDLLEGSLLLSSFLLVRREKHVLATVLLTFAILTKETAVLGAVSALIIYVFDFLRRQGDGLKWYYFAFPLAIFSVWQLILLYIWGEFHIFAGRINIGVPFTGFINSLKDVSAFQTPLQRRVLPELIFLLGFAVSVFYCLYSTLASDYEILSMILYAILIIFLSEVIWIEDWTFLRAITEFSLIGIIVLIGNNSKIRILIFGTLLIFWIYLFIRLLRHGE